MESTLECTFISGLVGCGEWRHFRLEQRPDTFPVSLLHALDEPGLSFIAADPRLWFPGYVIDLSPQDHEALQAGPEAELLVLALLTVEPQPFRVTANLLGPLVYNPANGLARQVILTQSNYSARQPVGGQVLNNLSEVEHARADTPA